MVQAEEIVAFWRQADPQAWYRKSPTFDEEIRHRFLNAHFAASRSELADWQAQAGGALALLLLLDQFPRNLFRGSAHAFATDPLARAAAKRAIAQGHDRATEPLLRQFFYLPLEHSEDPADQEASVELCGALTRETGDEGPLKWARLHQDIIRRFGRFPHRNTALGRETTPEEQAFLDGGGFKG